MNQVFQGVPAPPAPPPALNSIRTTYINLFNQILDSSININCICKTTHRKSLSNESSQPTTGTPARYIDGNDFMDDNDSDSDSDQNDIEMEETDENQIRLNQLSSLVQKTPECFGERQEKKICDLTCFENLKYIHNLLKNCFVKYTNEEEALNEFEVRWNSFKFLCDDPKSCDYYGTTIYHYAASDNNFELLKCLVNKFPDGVLCLDSKGMTPLMRAAQRNNYKCTEFLLNETSSELNGSLYSTYTPLWFGVSNGYRELVKLLLDFNANPSINDQHKKREITNSEFYSNEQLQQQRRDSENTTFLFSPIRASIVYSQFTIMNYLLEYGANVNELFIMVTPKTNEFYDAVSNENYVNSLKFFHRQFGQVIKVDGTSAFLTNLNKFVENQNVYRKMLIEFVKNVYMNIKLNPDLTSRIDQFLTTFGKNSIDNVINMTVLIEKPYQKDVTIKEYLSIINEFMTAIDQFISSEQIVTNENDENNAAVITNRRDYNDFVRNLIQKPNHHKNLFDFSSYLISEFHHTKSLKELARYNLRKQILNNIQSNSRRYTKEFTKSKYMEMSARSLNLPINLVNYLLHR